MKITFHLGAHRTDEDRLLRSLLRNNQKLAEEGIFVPGPSRYRDVLRDVSVRLAGQTANAETQDFLLDAILDDTEARHLVMSYDSFICMPGKIMTEGYYGRAGVKSAWLRSCFPDAEVRFALGIRNPATHVPAVFRGLKDTTHQAFLAGVGPAALLWAPAIERILADNPGSPVIVWCNEDTPLIWPDVMRTVADHAPETRLKGGFDILYQIMEAEGIKRLRAYLSSHPPQNELQRRRILAAFLDKYAKPEEVEEEVDFPGWDSVLVDRMTAAYEADVDRIQRLPGVTFIAP